MGSVSGIDCAVQTFRVRALGSRHQVHRKTCRNGIMSAVHWSVGEGGSCPFPESSGAKHCYPATPDVPREFRRNVSSPTLEDPLVGPRVRGVVTQQCDSSVDATSTFDPFVGPRVRYTTRLERRRDEFVGPARERAGRGRSCFARAQCTMASEGDPCFRY